MKNRTIALFLSLAFGISWLSGLVIYLTGGLTKSPELIKGTGITLALVLLASVYMWGPAIAHFFTRTVLKLGWKNSYLPLKFKQGWRYWLMGWFGPSLLTLIGAGVFFTMKPDLLDTKLTMLVEQLKAAGVTGNLMNPFNFVLFQTLTAFLIAPLLNLVSTFGEEFGWRAFLVPELSKFGMKKALIFSGLIWGAWHFPVILMGHNYGLGYTGYPWTGLLATLWVMTSFGVIFGWLALMARSVWPAVFAHGALNGIAAIGLFFVKSNPPMLLGPSPAGLIGCIPFTLAAILIIIFSRDEAQLPVSDASAH